MSEKYIYKTSDKKEFLHALHGIDYLIILWELDQWLRSKVKYSQEYQEETKQGFILAREQLHDLMQERDLSFDMLE